jgi:hypothetical protein
MVPFVQQQQILRALKDDARVCLKAQFAHPLFKNFLHIRFYV